MLASATSYGVLRDPSAAGLNHSCGSRERSTRVDHPGQVPLEHPPSVALQPLRVANTRAQMFTSAAMRPQYEHERDDALA